MHGRRVAWSLSGDTGDLERAVGVLMLNTGVITSGLRTAHTKQVAPEFPWGTISQPGLSVPAH